MDILMNGNKIDFTIENERTLGEILGSLESACEKAGMTITAIRVDGKTVFPETPEMMAAHLDELLAAGANIVGGCCGTGPAHIRALAEKIRKQ